MTLNSNKTVAIDREYPWLKIDEHTPRGVKLQLIRREAGVATYGALQSGDTFWTHWAPLPTFKKGE